MFVERSAQSHFGSESRGMFAVLKRCFHFHFIVICFYSPYFANSALFSAAVAIIVAVNGLLDCVIMMTMNSCVG